MKQPKYKKGDIVGACFDAMYEFRITSYNEDTKLYNAKCTSSYMKTIKVGQMVQLRGNGIYIKLGEKGKKWPLPDLKTALKSMKKS